MTDKNKRFGNSPFTVYIASVQCLLYFGRAFSAESLYPRYVRLHNCTRDDQCWRTLEFLFSQQKCADFQIQRAGEGFKVAGSPDPEAKRRVCLALEVTLQRCVKSNCILVQALFSVIKELLKALY